MGGLGRVSPVHLSRKPHASCELVSGDPHQYCCSSCICYGDSRLVCPQPILSTRRILFLEEWSGAVTISIVIPAGAPAV